MKNELIKKAIDASVKAKMRDLTNELKDAVKTIGDLLQALHHEMFTQRPWNAVNTLQVLSEASTRHAVTARVYEAQLTTILCMQEAANAEYTEEVRR